MNSRESLDTENSTGTEEIANNSSDILNACLSSPLHNASFES